MIRLSLILLFVFPLTVFGQDDFLRALAVEVCACLEGNATESVASDCLESKSMDKSEIILKRYGLDAHISVQRDKLAEMMIDYLLDVCPLLKTVRPENEENEFRWADSKRTAESAKRQFTSRKRPPADSLGTVTSEPPVVWRASGILLAQPGSKGLRLRTEDAQEIGFELPTSVARRRDFDAGDEISLSYRREWRPEEGRIVLVVTGID